MLHIKRLFCSKLLDILFFLATFMGILWNGAQSSVITINGTYSRCYGDAKGWSNYIKNETHCYIDDFTITIKKKGEYDLRATINKVELPNFYVDDDRNGSLSESEQDCIDDTPETIARIQALSNYQDIPPHEYSAQVYLFEIDFSTSTGGDWCLTLQPTDKKRHAIGEGIDSVSFKGKNSYYVTLSEEAAQIAPYAGLAFSDVNATGRTLTTLFLKGENFHITNAYQKDAGGLEIPGSIYNVSDGSLNFAAPVLHGERFYFAVEVDRFFGGSAMTVRATIGSRVPLLSRWGFFILVLLLVALSTIWIVKRKRVAVA